VPVYGVGEADGVHFYAMQFIQGQSLDQVLHDLRRLRKRSGETSLSDGAATLFEGSVVQGLVTGQFAEPRAAPGSTGVSAISERIGSGPHSTTSLSAGGSESQYFRSVARIGLQVADALAYAHRQGVLHRDVKPSNLLLDLQGTVWITDFGLAKAEGTDELTQVGDIVGTVRFMAPERFEGRADARSDVFSLGLTLYELATLKPAFAAMDRAQLIEHVLHDEPPQPRKLDPRLPRDLETIILKAIAKEPRARYAAAAEMAEDLRRFLADRPILARRSMMWERTWRWCRRNPLVAGLIAAVTVLIVVAAAGSGVAALRLNAALRRSEQAEQDEKVARQDALHTLWQAYRDQAETHALSRRMGQRVEGLKAVANATRLAHDLNLSENTFLELRNRAIACLALPDIRIAQEWDGWPDDSAHLDFDADLEHYVRTDRAGGVCICRVSDGTLLTRFASRLRNPQPLLSRDGRFLTLHASSRCELWKLDGPKPVLLVQEADCEAHDFSPDGRRLALVRSDGTIALCDLLSGPSLRRLKAGPHPVAFAAFHPDGRQLALSHAGGVQIRDLDQADVCIDLPQADAERLAWHPDGNRLAVVSSDLGIHLWDVAARQQTADMRRWKNGGLRIAFNHAGDLLASYGWEHMLRLWDLRSSSEVFHTPARFTGPNLRFSSDDRFVAADIQNEKLRLWEIVLSQECRKLIPNPARGQAPYGPFAIRPDGRVLAACTADGFGLWDAHTGDLLASVPVATPQEVVMFERSGALLTGGPSGNFRWPFEPDTSGAVRLGPPQRLLLPATLRTQFACSIDGRVLASAAGEGGCVLHADRPDRLIRLGPHEDARAVAVSPDGRWVVTGSQHGTGAKVWDARTGRLEKELLPQESFVRLSFSRDGRWLATRGNGLRLWEVGSWREGPILGGIPGAAFAFSPVERLLVTETGYGVLRLVDPDTGREYARLEDPDQVRSVWICFSPDGTQLLTAGAGVGAWIRVWDLRAIRRRLTAMGLDWDLPPYPSAGGPSTWYGRAVE
jgi:WD40 repeat protein